MMAGLRRYPDRSSCTSSHFDEIRHSQSNGECLLSSHKQGHPQILFSTRARETSSQITPKPNLIVPRSDPHETSAPSRLETQRFPNSSSFAALFTLYASDFDAFSSTFCRLWVSAVFHDARRCFWQSLCLLRVCGPCGFTAAFHALLVTLC
jgi:hypothetical protein